MPNPDSGLEIFSDVAVEEHCTASVVVECLDDLNKSFLHAEASHDVPQTFVPYSIECFFEVYEVVVKFFLVL